MGHEEIAWHLMQVYVEALRYEQLLRVEYLDDYTNDGHLWKVAVNERVKAYNAWFNELYGPQSKTPLTGVITDLG